MERQDEECALGRAQRVGDAAARGTGFDWEDAWGALGKVREEVEEVHAELERGDEAAAAAELGDLLFAAAMVARKLGVRAADVLDATTSKFEDRYLATLELLRREGIDPEEASIERMEQAWQAVKAIERGEG